MSRTLLNRRSKDIQGKNMLYTLALKNIFAYKSRTLTTFLLSMFTSMFFIVYVAFMDGSHNQIIKNSVEIYTGYAHLQLKGYEEEKNYDYLIEDTPKVKKILKNDPNVALFSPRFETYVLLSTRNKSISSMLAGIIPSKEAKLSHLKASLIKGTYLNDADTQAIYMGSELAKRLDIDIGDEIAMVGSSIDYSIAADLFTLKGIFKTGLFEFDSTSAFVNKNYLDSIMLSKNIASYFTLSFHDNKNIDQQTLHLKQKLPSQMEILSWKNLLSSLVQAMQVDSLFGYISISIFFLVIFFVIMIFSYVNIHTRTREIGLLRALGLTAKNINHLLFTEIFIITIVSIGIGTLLGAGIVYYLQENPIVISGMAEMYKEYGIVSDKIPTDFDLFTITWNTLSILALCLASVFYPIYKINQYSVIEAIRYV